MMEKSCEWEKCLVQGVVCVPVLHTNLTLLCIKLGLYISLWNRENEMEPTLSCPGSWVHRTFLALRDVFCEFRVMIWSRKREIWDVQRIHTDLQASHATFWRLGGGSVFASSWMWFCSMREGRPTTEAPAVGFVRLVFVLSPPGCFTSDEGVDHRGEWRGRDVEKKEGQRGGRNWPLIADGWRWRGWGSIIAGDVVGSGHAAVIGTVSGYFSFLFFFSLFSRRPYVPRSYFYTQRWEMGSSFGNNGLYLPILTTMYTHAHRFIYKIQ